MDYIRLKQEVLELERAAADLKRKQEIAEMEGRRAAATLAQARAMRKAGTLPGGAAAGGAGLIAAAAAAAGMRTW
jgi:hypothetical protein